MSLCFKNNKENRKQKRQEKTTRKKKKVETKSNGKNELVLIFLRI